MSESDARKNFFAAYDAHDEAVGNLASEVQRSGGQNNPVLDAARAKVTETEVAKGAALQQLAREKGQNV